MKQLQPNSLKKNLLFNVLYQAINTLAPLLTVPYVSRVLGADNIGIYSYSLAIVNYFCIIGVLGSSVYGQLEISKHRDDKEKISKSFFIVLFSRAITLFLSFVCYILFIFAQSQNQSLYIILLFYFASQMVDVTWLFQGLEKFDITVPCSALAKIISIVCIFLFVKDKNDLVLYAGLINGSCLLGNLLMWISIKKYVSFYPIKTMEIFYSIKSNLIFFVPTIATVIFSSFDKCMISWITNSKYENGCYEQASKIYNTLVTLITALTTVMLPRMAYLWENDSNITKIREYLIKTIRYVAILTFPIALGMFTVADEFVSIFFGDGYEKCISLIRIFAFVFIFTCFNSIISNQCLVASGNQRKLNKLFIISSSINVILNSFFICYWQSVGAALASLVSEGALLSLNIFINRKLLPNNICFKYVLKYLGYSIIMALLLYPIKFLKINTIYILFVEIMVGVFSYGFILFITKDDMLFEVLNKSKRFLIQR